MPIVCPNCGCVSHTQEELSRVPEIPLSEREQRLITVVQDCIELLKHVRDENDEGGIAEQVSEAQLALAAYPKEQT